MTLIQPPMMVNGGIHPARTMRMMIRDLSRGAQGVTEYNDLKVTPLTTPGAGVQIADGSGVVREPPGARAPTPSTTSARRR